MHAFVGEPGFEVKKFPGTLRATTLDDGLLIETRKWTRNGLGVGPVPFDADFWYSSQ